MPKYDPNIPQGTDFIYVSQKQILSNFEALGAYFAKDHFAWRNPSGKAATHKWLQLPEEGSDPTTLSDELALYTKDVGGTTELFFRADSNGTVTQITDTGGGSFPITASVMGMWDGNGVLLGESNGITSVTPNTSSSPQGFDVVFSSAQPDTDYIVMAAKWTFGAVTGVSQQLWVTNKTTTGCTVVGAPIDGYGGFLVVTRV